MFSKKNKQMKFSKKNSTGRNTPIDNALINEEHTRAKTEMLRCQFSSEFVFIMLCRRDRLNDIFSENLPSNLVVVCSSELQTFYGDAYYQRFKP